MGEGSDRELLAIRRVTNLFVNQHHADEAWLLDTAWQAFQPFARQREGAGSVRSAADRPMARIRDGLGLVGDEMTRLVTPIVLMAVSEAMGFWHKGGSSVQECKELVAQTAAACGASPKVVASLAYHIPALCHAIWSTRLPQLGPSAGARRNRRVARGGNNVKAGRRSADAKLPAVGDTRGVTARVGSIIGHSDAIANVVALVAEAGSSDVTVLVTGETGVGKGVVARAVHEMSRRWQARYVSATLADVPETLVDSELFGHVAGAFTGATAERAGVLQMADGGTLFLDEVGDLGSRIQLKLLRFLDSREFEPVGGTETEHVDARVIAATNRDLAQAVLAGDFRQDLYYRLYVFPIHVPPLRQRKEDIPLLADHLGRAAAEKNGMDWDGLSDGAIQRLVEHEWPGNVRELQNCMERALVRSKGQTIQERHISFAPLGPRTESLALPDLKTEAVLRALRGSRKVAHAWHKLGIPRSTFYDLCDRLHIRPRHELGRDL